MAITATTTTTITTPSVFEKKEERSSYGKIPFSDVEVRRKPTRGYWAREWVPRDLVMVGVVLYVHVLALFAPFYCNWGAVKVAFVLYIVVGLFGVTLSYHRHLAHQSFQIPKWLEYLLAYCGLHSLQGDPIDWVSRHRFHHKYTDKDQDPHSPTEGFWFSHISWIFDTSYVIQKCGKRKNVQDLRQQWFYRFLQATHLLHPLALGAILYRYGGFAHVAWGLGVRVVWCYHITFLVNSACHVWGYQTWNTGDFSKNNWWVTVLAFGEGWHNNHHAFAFSARHGIEWWEVDVTWCVIRFLEVIGLATNVKVPTALHKEKMASKNRVPEDVKVPSEIQKQSLE